MCQQQLHYTFEIDHIQPLFANGSNDEGNLQAICAQCHRIKTLEEAQPEEMCTYRHCHKCHALISNYTKHVCHAQPAAKEKRIADSLKRKMEANDSSKDDNVNANKDIKAIITEFNASDGTSVDEWFEQFRRLT